MFIAARKKVLVFLIIIFLFISFGLYASGSSEESVFDEAEALIEARDYNSALSLLAGLLKTDPDKMDRVQSLLDRIRLAKENYNNRYGDLIETYSGDDVQAAYPIIKELEELDTNPNEATRMSLVIARETAGFIFNNRRWLEIMETAAKQLEQEEFNAAIETYMSGFTLSRDIFKDAGYDPVIVYDIFVRADEMDALSLESIAMLSRMSDSLEKIGELYELGNIDEYTNAVAGFYPELVRSAEIRELLKDIADYFIVQEKSIREEYGVNKQIYYLVYMDRLLNGRTTVESAEGISGVIEIFWNKLYDELLAYGNDYTEAVFNKAYQQYVDGEYDKAEKSFETVLTAAKSENTILDFGVKYFNSDAQLERDGLLKADELSMDTKMLYLQQEIRAAESFMTLIDKKKLIDDFEDRIRGLDENPDDFVKNGLPIKEELFNESKLLESLYASEKTNAAGNPQSDEDPLIQRINYISSLPIGEYRKFIDILFGSEIKLFVDLLNTQLSGFESGYEDARVMVDESSKLLKGIKNEEASESDNTLEGLEFDVIYKYPDKALEQMIEIQTVIEKLLKSVVSLEDGIDSERTEVRNNDLVAVASGAAEDLIRRVRALFAELNGLKNAAEEQIFTAEKLKQEGERRIAESKKLTEKANFAAAKERLEQAAAKFDESLSYLEDPLLRAFRDEDIPRLYDEIQVAENNLVVKQVREYLTKGKLSYSEANFPIAQSVLLKAQSRWADTNIEPNAEVEYWLNLAQTALSVTSGRTIEETDPLYPEMSQYLNQAKSDFKKARLEYDRGKTDKADDYFISAEKSILYVQQFFPFNEEARVLNLRISQYRDPERFKELFKSDFNNAKKRIDTNPRAAYIDLKDLESIYPSYPGLKAAIINAEYASGIKVRPPDPKELKRSTELYDLAYSIVRRNVRSEFNVAISYLDEAIKLNPDNDEAIRLKDRISTDVGGTTAEVMSNTNQQLYNEAVNEFTSGNYLKARIIVERLLKDPDNQRNPKLMDLKERIERTR